MENILSEIGIGALNPNRPERTEINNWFKREVMGQDPREVTTMDSETIIQHIYALSAYATYVQAALNTNESDLSEATAGYSLWLSLVKKTVPGGLGANERTEFALATLKEKPDTQWTPTQKELNKYIELKKKTERRAHAYVDLADKLRSMGDALKKELQRRQGMMRDIG